MKFIRDPVHEYISLSDIEHNIVDSAYFQRLRHIKQLSMTNFVYPSALGSRFEHSLGVMHLAGEIFSSIYEISKKSQVWKEWYKTAKRVFGSSVTPEYLRNIVRLVALLHDIGHLPFSHTFERLIRDYNVYDPSLFPETADKLLPHEEASYLIIKEIYQTILREDFHHVLNVLAPPTKEASMEEYQVYMFLHLIWKGQLDADKLDYVLRDAYMSGVGFGKYDLKRIMHNLFIIKSRDDFLPAPHVRALSAVDSIISERYKLHQWVYFHHVVVLLDELVRRVTKFFMDSDKSLKGFLHFRNYIHDAQVFDDTFLLQFFRNKCVDPNTDAPIKNYLQAICRRENLPVSLWKDLLSFRRINFTMAEYIRTLSAGRESIPYPLNMLIELKDDELRDLENAISLYFASKGKEEKVILATKIFSPYRPGGIRILDRNGSPSELKSVSLLVEGIMNYWHISPQVYVFIVGEKARIKADQKAYESLFIEGVKTWLDTYSRPDPETRLAIFLKA